MVNGDQTVLIEKAESRKVEIPTEDRLPGCRSRRLDRQRRAGREPRQLVHDIGRIQQIEVDIRRLGDRFELMLIRARKAERKRPSQFRESVRCRGKSKAM